MGQKDNSALTKIRFSIGAKLIIIITLIVLISLGSIIALASWLVRGDMRIMAEENNFETNRRTAMAAQSVLENIHSNSLILITTITSVGTETNLARETTDFFFERNQNAACIFFTAGDHSEILINEHFFEAEKLDSSLSQSYRDSHITALLRAASGDITLSNAAPHFAFPLIALFFPWQYGGAGVLFSPAELNDSFGYGVNQSYLVNDSGDILIHGDFNMVRSAANVANSEFMRYIRENSERNAQTLYTGDDGVRYFGAFTKLDIAGAVVITNVEYNKVFEGIAATTRRNLYLAVTVLSISIILIWFFSKSISNPLKTLASAAHDIEEGSFAVTLPEKSQDEIGVLTDSFQRMSKALGIFGRFTNRDIAVRAMRGEIKPGGLLKNATIFFSDIRDFTSTSENFTKAFGDEGSDRIVQWLNEYFTKMVDCVERTGGVVDKFIGDAIMAHWGTAYTTGSARKDAYNCISAALMMRKALHVMNRGRKKDDPACPPIRIGIGINSGMATAGQIGSDLRMEYTVIGDPVNLASRLESLNKMFGTDILIGENTWRLVKKKFIMEEMPSARIKGKQKRARVFAVINFARENNGPKSLARLRKILGIKEPENLKLDASSAQKKYRIVSKKY
jgi:adenylate cyclase